jgi:hypothetical protein
MTLRTPVSTFVPAFAAMPAYSPLTWILTLTVSIGWMKKVAVHPDVPPITNGLILSQVLIE